MTGNEQKTAHFHHHAPVIISSYVCYLVLLLSVFWRQTLIGHCFRKNWWTGHRKKFWRILSNFLPNPSHPFFKTDIIKTLCAPGRCDISPEMGLFWRNALAELCSRTGDRKTGWLTLVNGYWAGGFKEPVEGSLRVLSEEKRSHETGETLFVLTSDWEHRLSKCYKHTAVWSERGRWFSPRHPVSVWAGSAENLIEFKTLES